jgi:redox-sensing transcriptional repressor
MKKNARKAPAPVIRRLSNYHHLLVGLKQSNRKTISSTTIAEMLEYKPIQVRKDLQLIGLVGRPKVGFRIAELTEAIQSFLGWKSNCRAILVGAGNLGKALLKYPWDDGYGIEIVAAFDADKKRSGVTINGIPVYHQSAFPAFAAKDRLDVGIIAVPAAAAQTVAEVLASNGIRGIWNFSPTHLKVSAPIAVVDAFFTQSLALLTRRMIEGREE